MHLFGDNDDTKKNKYINLMYFVLSGKIQLLISTISDQLISLKNLVKVIQII